MERPAPQGGAKIKVAKRRRSVPRKAAIKLNVPVPKTDTGG